MYKLELEPARFAARSVGGVGRRSSCPALFRFVIPRE